MFFTIKSPKNLPISLAKAFAIKRACDRVGLYRVGVAEAKLNDYFSAACGKTLKAVCKEIISRGEILAVEGHLIFKFNDGKDDRTAKLIAYGNGAMQGSGILRYALFR